MRLALMFGLLGGWLAFAPAAYAEDFTFAVPIRIENLRFAEAGRLTCRVHTPAGSRSFSAAPVDFTITDGAYRATLNPVVNLPAGERRDGMDSWDCYLYFSYRPPGGALVPIGDAPPRAVSEYARTTRQEITSSRVIISGTFSR